MSTLRLGAYKLPAAEVVLVQTLFRLYAHGDAFRWTFVTAPPYDALLADGTTDEGMSPAVDAMAKAVLRLTRMNSGQAPNTLERPIRADRLQDWLKSTEHDLLQTRPATLIEEATQPDAVEAEATTPAAPINPVRFKLRRWPPAVLLRWCWRHKMITALAAAALLAGSTLASADMAHATHPNYPDRHEPAHQIAINGGPVLKVQPNLRYATDGRTADEVVTLILERLAHDTRG